MEAVIFIGIQAAGKTSFFRERFFDSHVRINLDMLKTRYREAVLVSACLDAKQPFVIDNTNPSIAERARYIHAARAARFHVTGYYFHTPLDEALARNSRRQAKACVPNIAIFGTQKRLQLPTRAEGFDTLRRVTLDDDNGFVVVEWTGIL